jgi:hypothetical protein
MLSSPALSRKAEQTVIATMTVTTAIITIMAAVTTITIIIIRHHQCRQLHSSLLPLMKVCLTEMQGILKKS